MPLTIWYISLDWYAGKLLSQASDGNILDFQSQKIFKQRNEKFQKEMAEVFNPYHYRCRRCQYCCMIDLPFYQVDCVLYGLKPRLFAPLMVAPTRFQELMKVFLLWITPTICVRKLKILVHSKEKSSQVVKPACPCWMWTEHGCKYDYGQRPTYCVLHLCKGLIGEMDWADYRRYITVSSRYLAYLTHSMKDVAAELSSLQKKA